MSGLPSLIERLRDVGRIAWSVAPTNRGFVSYTSKAMLAQLLFTRVFESATSLLRLVDSDPLPDTGRDVFDPPAVASLTRNLVEAHDAFWFICVDKVSAAESTLRRAVWRIHYYREYANMLEELKPDGYPFTGMFEAAAGEQHYKLGQNPAFKRLTPKQQRAVFEGRRRFLTEVRNADRARVMKSQEAAAFYRLLSNHTHTTAFATWLTNPNRWPRALDSDYLIAACMIVAASELAMATRSYVRRMRRFDGGRPQAWKWLEAVATQPISLQADDVAVKGASSVT